MDTALTNALKRKKELEDELAKVSQFIALYSEFSGANQQLLGETPVRLRMARLQPRTVRRLRLRRSAMKPSTLATIAENVLRDVRRPLTRSALVQEIEKRNYLIPTQGDKGQYLATILWRHKGTFENIEGQGYWLKDVPVPSDTREYDLTGKLNP